MMPELRSRGADRVVSPIPARLLLLASLALAATGCGTVKGWFGGKKGKEVPPVALVEFAPTATVSQLWAAGLGGGEERFGLRQGPVVADGRVYAASLGGSVAALALDTGQALWRVSPKFGISSGPGVGDGVVAVGGLEGDVLALDAATGAEKWRAKVGSEVIAAPAVGQGMVFVRGSDGRVTALDAATGARRWFWSKTLPLLSVRGSDAPQLGPGVLFVGNDDGSVTGLSAAAGTEGWTQSVAQAEGRSELDRMADVDGTPALEGTTLYASSYKRKTMAIDATSGQPLWQAEAGGPGRVGLAGDKVVVADPAGTVWGLDKASGSALWQNAALARRQPGSVAIQGNYAVVGDYDGYLHWLRLDTGAFAARTRLGGSAIRGAPVVSNGILVVQNSNGGIAAFRVQ